jgi:hypothetical protein
MKKYIILIFLCISFNSTKVLAITLAECNIISSTLNADFPLKIDAKTTVMSSACFNKKRFIYLRYLMRLEVNHSKISPDYLKLMKSFQLNLWCTEPEQLKLLKVLGINYSYINLKGEFMGETIFTIKDCP